MSALWCLTGSLDTRPFEDSKVADVINDNAKVGLPIEKHDVVAVSSFSRPA